MMMNIDKEQAAEYAEQLMLNGYIDDWVDDMANDFVYDDMTACACYDRDMDEDDPEFQRIMEERVANIKKEVWAQLRKAIHIPTGA